MLLYTSFNPLVVLFLHTIASSSAEDLELLRQVTGTLEDIQHISKQCERLYLLAEDFCRVARILIESQKTVGVYSQQANTLSFADTAKNFHAVIGDNMEDIQLSEFNNMDAFLAQWLGDDPTMDMLDVNVLDHV